MVDRNKVFWTV
jgi:hypothetical protein